MKELESKAVSMMIEAYLLRMAVWWWVGGYSFSVLLLTTINNI
jgi:hypothetical protein